MTDYDLIILGSGSAAAKVAHSTASEGWDVAITESRRVGGTCALRGCMPKKVYVGAAETIDWAHRLDDHGITADVDIDWHDIQDFKQSFTDDFNDGIRQGFEDAGIDILKGRASFEDEHTITVKNTSYTAESFLIATGAKPRPLSFTGHDHLITSDEFLDLQALPDNIVFVGGGYISFEFAHVAARTGSEVTILQRDDQPLPMFEESIVDELIDTSEETGIDIHLNTQAGEVEQHGDTYYVYDETGEQISEADLVVHGAGRIPQVDDLNLDKAGVDTEHHGVTVNDALQTTQDHIYAAGDCAASPGYPLTPIATMEGQTVSHNLLNDDSTKPNYEGTATTLFSIPPVASVGMHESQVREKGYEYTVNDGDSGSWFSSQRIGVDHGRYKVIIDNATDEILGAHLIGHNAEEVINIFAAAIRHDITASELKATPWSYPTSTADTDYML